MRRLITLISAGRSRIVVVRRELPRTEDAGWVSPPYRTKMGGCCFDSGRAWLPLSSFNAYGNGPDKAQQAASTITRRRCELPVLVMEPGWMRLPLEYSLETRPL
jgi:hypothetical protein